MRQPRITSFGRHALGLILGLGLVQGASLAAASEDDPWPDLREALFEDRPIQDGSGVISLEAPTRAYDAALVPVTLTAEMAQTSERYIKSITLVIDKNPAPVAAVFNTSPLAGNATIATRIRINEYTNVRAIAETSDGQLYMATKFVKASGGCAAPASKDSEAAMARLGKMKLKQSQKITLGQPNSVQLLISHPNYSGLQMDQLTRLYVPARFVQDIEVRYGDETILSVEGSISLSEDPAIRFSFIPNDPGEISVEVRDSEDTLFSGSWPVTPDASS